MAIATEDLTTGTAETLEKRKLIFHDSVAFVSLLAVTVALFAVTLFLFRSFTVHRTALAQRWSDRGREALKAGQPDEAIVALRTALSYAPGTKSYELLLAQALGDAGHTDESYNYFLGLWDAEPGNGFINLQLARLAAKKDSLDHDAQARQAAINYYRAAIYGTWEGDGVARRAAVRLELAQYLIAQHDLPAARMELLIAGGNAADDPELDNKLGELLIEADDPADAWTYYQKTLAAKPNDTDALEAAGRIAYEAGDYAAASRLLTHAIRDAQPSGYDIPPAVADMPWLLWNANRILKLTPSPSLPPRERVDRILTMRGIAKARFDDCAQQLAAAGPLPAAMADLKTRWAAPEGTADARALLKDDERQDAALQLAYDTETESAKACNDATNDDDLILLIAKGPAAPLPLTSAAQGGR